MLIVVVVDVCTESATVATMSRKSNPVRLPFLGGMYLRLLVTEGYPWQHHVEEFFFEDTSASETERSVCVEGHVSFGPWLVPESSMCEHFILPAQMKVLDGVACWLQGGC